MDKLRTLITNILKEKCGDDVEEVKLDLKRVLVSDFGADKADLGYIEYLWKHYQNDISIIESAKSLITNNFSLNQTSMVENIRNYLIKIAIIRICKQRNIDVIIGRMDNIDYCLELVD